MSVANIIITICSTITGMVAVGTLIYKAVSKTLEKTLEPINKKIDDMDRRECQTNLIDFLCDVENGVEKDETQWKHAHTIYDHYTNDLHGNSYVHDKWERVVAVGEK